jgi:hypothetical protein
VSGKTKTLLDLHICPARALTTAAGNPAEDRSRDAHARLPRKLDLGRWCGGIPRWFSLEDAAARGDGDGRYRVNNSRHKHHRVDSPA